MHHVWSYNDHISGSFVHVPHSRSHLPNCQFYIRNWKQRKEQTQTMICLKQPPNESIIFFRKNAAFCPEGGWCTFVMLWLWRPRSTFTIPPRSPSITRFGLRSLSWPDWENKPIKTCHFGRLYKQPWKVYFFQGRYQVEIRGAFKGDGVPSQFRLQYSFGIVCEFGGFKHMCPFYPSLCSSAIFPNISRMTAPYLKRKCSVLPNSLYEPCTTFIHIESSIVTRQLFFLFSWFWIWDFFCLVGFESFWHNFMLFTLRFYCAYIASTVGKLWRTQIFLN